LVSYDDYDNSGYLLDIRHGVFHELNERDTCILNTVLCGAHLASAPHSLSPQLDSESLEMEVSSLLERLQGQKLLEPQTGSFPGDSPRVTSAFFESLQKPGAGQPEQQVNSVTLKQRLVGAAHIISVLNELRKEDEGLYQAHQYILKLRESWEARDASNVLSAEAALQRSRGEYWFYRLITGLIERRVARLLGQMPGDEGLCMVRAFALCAYLLVLGVPAQIVIARPKYGSRSGFKLHVWAEMNGKPLNEAPNIRDRYRVLSAFPSYP
jgi:hypothetical protein